VVPQLWSYFEEKGPISNYIFPQKERNIKPDLV